jgi:hypothetical protein
MCRLAFSLGCLSVLFAADFFSGIHARNSTQGAPSPWEVEPRNIVQDTACAVVDLFEEFNGACVWGQNCGGGCAPYQKEGIEDYNGDDLDYACLQHDMCLCRAETSAEADECDRVLQARAAEIEDATDDCTGLNNFNPFCWSDPINCAAANGT